jgi:hypothetical protein
VVVAPTATPGPVGARPSGGTPPAGPVLPAEKAPILVDPADALVLRGGAEGGRRAFLERLAAALEPYRRGDFAEAAERLAVVGERHPEAPEPGLYRGVSLLLLGRPEEAAAPLRNAAARATNAALRAEARYHLAVALSRSGDVAGARAELRASCTGGGAATARACTALERLGGPAASAPSAAPVR